MSYTLTEMNVNDQDNGGNTPLHVAVENHELDVVRFLASHNDVSFLVKNYNQEAALHVAVKLGDLETLEVSK